MSGVRVAGGLFRGRKMPVAAGVRPTSGRTREALFSIWKDELPRGAFLDLFAGSATVCLEAVSRGAAEVVGIEGSERTVRQARTALAGFSLEGAQIELRRATLPGELSKVLGRSRRFHLIFADPPYDFEPVDKLLVAASQHLLPGGELALERSSRSREPCEKDGQVLEGLVFVERRVYGESALSFFRRPD